MDSRTTRRVFLGGSIALAGTPFPAGLTAAGQPGEPKVGVATYSLRKFSRAQAIAMLKQLQVRYVSVKSFHAPYESSPGELAAARKEFEDAGLTILSVGNVPLDKPDQLRAMFEYAKNFGAPMMVCAPTHETLPEVEKLVKEYNIRVAIHNHGPEDKRFPTPQSVLKAVKGMDRRVGLCIDIGHTARTGADVVESITEAGPRLLDLHFKDLKNPSEKASQVAVGEGELPIVAIFKTLRRMRYQGGAMLEYEIHADAPLPGMQRSIGYMEGVLAGLRG